MISLSPIVTPANSFRTTIGIVAMKNHLLSAVEDNTVKYLGVLAANAL